MARYLYSCGFMLFAGWPRNSTKYLVCGAQGPCSHALCCWLGWGMRKVAGLVSDG